MGNFVDQENFLILLKHPLNLELKTSRVEIIT